MFQRFFQWFKDQKAWKADHIRTWSGMTALDSGGISKFQNAALSALENHGVQLPFQRMGEAEAYFLATIPNTEIEVFIYSDGAHVSGDQNLLRAEEWDYRTPDDLIQDLISTVCKRLPADPKPPSRKDSP